jgi:hypothetical protein
MIDGMIDGMIDVLLSLLVCVMCIRGRQANIMPHFVARIII